MRRYRVWIIGEAMRAVRHSATGRNEQLIFVTIIPPQGTVPTGKLRQVNLQRYKDWLWTQLKRLGCADRVIGGVDGSYESSSEAWQIHFHLIASSRTRSVFDRLRRYCKKTSTGSLPIVIQEVTDLAATVSYCFKGFWQERVHFVGKSSGKTHSRKRRLSWQQHLEWLRWRLTPKFMESLFLYRARRWGNHIH
jgi:hypothetical protein